MTDPRPTRLSLESLATVERMKRHPKRWAAECRRQSAKAEATAAPYLEREAEGQARLDFEEGSSRG